MTYVNFASYTNDNTIYNSAEIIALSSSHYKNQQKENQMKSNIDKYR